MKSFCPVSPHQLDLLRNPDSTFIPSADNNHDHESFTQRLLESEPAMLRAILVVVPNRADAREISRED